MMGRSYRPLFTNNHRVFIRDDGFGAASFRAPHGIQRRPVKGGRWMIRKRLWGEKPWRAWTNGAGQKFRRNFATQREAIFHATMVAQMFANPTPENVERVCRITWPNATEESIQNKIVTYSKVSGNR